MVEPPTGSGRDPQVNRQESEVRPSPGGSSFHHLPVMVDQVVDLVAPLPAGTFLDATIGGGGHAEAVLEANPRLAVVGLDRDPAAVDASTVRLERFGHRATVHRARFDELDDRVLVEPPLSGFLFDLGVSSPQLDRAERGFSFRNDGPLDMRMDPDSPVDADDVINAYDERRLAELIHRYSDERFAGRISAAIVAARPVASTAELAQIVAAAIPAAARRRGGHPARRTFQAIRIEVNDELAVLGSTIETALDALTPGGRGMVMTYHSGEDRIVKDSFRRRTTIERPPGLPVEGPSAPFTIVRPAVRRPRNDELQTNPRASSAKLRTIERAAA